MRAAAYQALAKIDDPAAVAVLAKAIAGKDLDLAASAIVESKSPTARRRAGRRDPQVRPTPA